MASLREALATLTQPAPDDAAQLDGSDDFDGTAARVDIDDGDGEAAAAPSALRRSVALSTEALGERYSGRVVSRDDLFDTQPLADDDDDDASSSGGPSVCAFTRQPNTDGGGDGALSEAESDDSETLPSADVVVDSESRVATVRRVDASAHAAKGRAVLQQLKLWDQLLGWRIRVQKLLQAANEFPRGAEYDAYVDGLSDTDRAALASSQLSVKKLFEKSFAVLENFQLGSTNADDDEVLSSDSGDEPQKESLKDSLQSSRRRKVKPARYGALLAEKHTASTQKRNELLHKWNESSKLSKPSRATARRDFSAFETDVVQQIDKVLADKERLIRRTQLKRAAVDRLDKEQGAEEERDEEAFNDDDFYQQLLRELVERKAEHSDDPVELSRQWLLLQRLRHKRRKKRTDTKASKGRKVRYDVQPKLVNFLAPVDDCRWTQERRAELFSSLFGAAPPPPRLQAVDEL